MRLEPERREYHFVAPWAYSGARGDAMRRVVAVATGRDPTPPTRRPPRRRKAAAPANAHARDADPDPPPPTPPPRRAASADVDAYGMDRREVNRWIVETTGAFVTRRPLPPRPTRASASASSSPSSSYGDSVGARVAAYDEAAGYLRLVVGEGDDPEAGPESAPEVFDLELLFWEDDEVVNVRAASRDAPRRGRWSLSYVDGARYDRNSARAAAEALRVALGWEILPVVSEFDPRFNNSKRLWFERALDFGGFDASVMDERRGR